MNPHLMTKTLFLFAKQSVNWTIGLPKHSLLSLSQLKLSYYYQ